MNSNAATVATNLPVPRTPLSQRLLQHVTGAWRDWRAQVRLAREIRALEALSDATLRDIGLAERVPYRPPQPLRDYERGRW